jgi:uncharacterized protein (TIGR02246 family)
MKALLPPVVFLILFSMKSFGQAGDMETIKKLNEDWFHSIQIKDSSILSNILADDFVMVNAGGATKNKHDNLMTVVSPGIEIISSRFDSVKVRLITPDVAILSAWASFSMKENGKTTNGKNCYQDIYMKRKNKWVAVSAHVTWLGSE